MQAGEVRVTKHVEIEHVRIERRPATGASAAGARIENDEIRVPVSEEEARVPV